jgi:WD repeat-containing protein 26
MISTAEDLKSRTGWDGKSGLSRQHVLASVEGIPIVRTSRLPKEIISPTALVPANRLVTLLQQAKDFQVRQCLFHLRVSDGPHSLLVDHACDSNAFPSTTVKILTGHTDEVWDIKFSHDGTKLASSSKDNCVIIWDTEACHCPSSLANLRLGNKFMCCETILEASLLWIGLRMMIDYSLQVTITRSKCG